MDENLQEGREMLAALGIAPAYVVSATDDLQCLTDAEHRVAFGDASTIAFTSPVADLLFQNALRYEWRGRGFCCVFNQAPVTMTGRERLGVLLHEAAHWVNAFDNDTRDDTDHKRAVTGFWSTMGTDKQTHGKRWLRSLVHLWSRASAAGYAVGITDCLNLDQYGFNRTDLLPFLAEAESRHNEPVEKILASSMPAAKARSKPRSAQRKRTPRNRAKGPNVIMTPAGPLTSFADGSCGTAPSLDGRVRAKRYPSFRAFLAAGAEP